MDTTATATDATRTASGGRSTLRAATVGALVATVVNLAKWAIGRAAGAGFVVDPALGDPNLEVGALKVVVTTLLPFAVGALLLAVAARQSGRWVLGVASVGAAVAVSSAVGPLVGGHDTATSVLLATMHLTTGAAFVVVATRVRGRGEAGDRPHGRRVSRLGIPGRRPRRRPRARGA